MAILITCDFCGSPVQTLETAGKTEASKSVDDTEKRCSACTVKALRDAWPTIFPQVRQAFVSNRMPELKNFFVVNIKRAFVLYVKERAKAHFGSDFDTVWPYIKAEIEALSDTPITVTVSIG
jgi:hypothetical protein